MSRLERVRAALARSPDPLERPIGAHFAPMPGEVWRERWRAFAQRGREGHRSVVLYVHVPFCARVCSYCLLAARKIERRDVVDRYVDALVAEIRVMGELLDGSPISAMHVGGGTPTVLSEAQLERVLGAAEEAFVRAPRFVGGIEAHPGSTTPQKLEVIARHGIDRVSFGVESFTPEVLRAVGRREQTQARVARAVEAAHAAGIGHVNVDLLAGLPGETVESFEESARLAAELGIDSMSINRFLGEGSALGAFGAAADAEEHARVGGMLLAADRLVRDARPPTFPRERLEQPAYGTQYVWDPEGTARRYFQEDMIGPASTLAVGHGGMGHLHGGAYAIAGAPLDRWIDAQLDGRAPPVLAWDAGPRFEQAFFVADRACRGELEPAAFERVFGETLEQAFGPELSILREEGLWSESDHRVRSEASATEVLCLLFCDDASLDAAPEPSSGATAPELTLTSTNTGEIAARIAELAASGARAVRLDVSRGTTTDEAQALLDAVGALDVVVETVGAEAPAARQYALAGADLPPSLLWCRLAIRAIAALRRMEADAPR